ncbi:hypothetical protein H2199_006917 [Coniosporium tulheliwenetii]|uniref:Uncharacterized protein n=1 Tax=Coniosporium tulheliwenetii TaxID=3383036 RepID=A0ACC2YSK0_9PEZI|nr:hypothetical protein H2199_006917 [Cladosporium sp. JES 115]
MATTISNVISQYPVVCSIAGELTTRELFNLARTCKGHWHYIHHDKTTWDNIKTLTKCDAQSAFRRNNGRIRDLNLGKVNPDCPGKPANPCERHADRGV